MLTVHVVLTDTGTTGRRSTDGRGRIDEVSRVVRLHQIVALDEEALARGHGRAVEIKPPSIGSWTCRPP